METLTAVLLGTLTITSYMPVPEQTDSSPNWTSIGQHVHEMGVAVSQDLLASGEACYGDVVGIPGYGLKVVNDVMGETKCAVWVGAECVKRVPIRRAFDILVFTKKQEAAVGVRRLPVTVIRSEKRFCSKIQRQRTKGGL